MSDDLRARIERAVGIHLRPSLECEPHPDETAIVDSVMAVVEPALHRARHYVRGQCRHCGGRPDAPGRMRRDHLMRCPLYVGPLEHRKSGESEMLIGYVNDCLCGRSWRPEEDGCPDAALDWRGPRAAA